MRHRSKFSPKQLFGIIGIYVGVVLGAILAGFLVLWVIHLVTLAVYYIVMVGVR